MSPVDETVSSDQLVDEVRQLAATLAVMNRDSWSAVMMLGQVHATLMYLRDRDRIAEAFRTGRSFSYWGDEPPTRERVVWGRPRVPSLKAPTLDKVLKARASGVVHQRPRERKERRTSRTVGSRGDPDPEPELPLTPLQEGQLLLLEALVVTSRGGLRVFAAFLELLAIRVAAEIARLHDLGGQA
jgi:hypothetical protein